MARAKEWNVKDMCSRKSNAKKFTDGVKATCEETGLQALTQPLLMGYLKSQLSTLPDKRIGHNKQHSMLDAGLSAFAVFFMQLPSFLAQQQLMLQARGGCNAFSLFGLSQIPSDNRIRQLLDPISPDLLNPLFDQIFEALMARKTLEPFRHVNDTLLMALDGVHYFASNKLNCDCCSERAHRDGVVSYSHAAVAVAVVSPDNSEVISLAPEFITPQDGCSKQDCELNAAKRWLSQHGERYVQHQVTLLGDDLYAHQPFCEQVLAQHFHFIFTCKPSSHVFLYEWLKDLREPHLKTVTYLRRVGNKTCRDT